MSILKQVAYCMLCLNLYHTAEAATHTAPHLAKPPATPVQKKSLAQTTKKFNLNTIDAVRLALAISGIGEKRAAAIVAYRKQHGAFKSLKDLAKVKGIGKHFVEQHWDEINKQLFVSS